MRDVQGIKTASEVIEVEHLEPQMAENRYLPLTCDITLITVTHYRATLYTVIMSTIDCLGLIYELFRY